MAMDSETFQKAQEMGIVPESLSNFKDPNLLKHILKELSKDHIGDDNLKMTGFLVATSGLLKNPKNRMSMAIRNNSSEGKDNMIKTELKHMPRDSFIFLTSATQSTIEDDLKDKRIMAFSEVNANREIGANKFLVEVLKQKTEGGTSSVKKDIRDGMKSARFDVGEQGTVLYGTTETSGDDELKTRFIEGTLKSSESKIEKVNHNTLDIFSDIDKIMNDAFQEDSWIRKGLTSFFSQKDQYEIYIPYANFLKEKINESSIFDNASPRSQRDLKRLLSLTCAMTYLFQLQRKVIDHNGLKVLVSEPQDLINTLKFSSDSFNQSYSGLDGRLLEVIKIIEEHNSEWTPRDYVQEQMNVTRNTIKSYCGTLSNEGCLKGIKGSELNCEKNLRIYDGNKIYYQRCQKGIKKPLIRCQLKELREFLELKTQKVIDTFEFDDLIYKTEENDAERYQNKGIKKGVNVPQEAKDGTNMPQIDTLGLTPSQIEISFIEDTGSFMGFDGREIQAYNSGATILMSRDEAQILIQNRKAIPRLQGGYS